MTNTENEKGLNTEKGFECAICDIEIIEPFITNWSKHKKTQFHNFNKLMKQINALLDTFMSEVIIPNDTSLEKGELRE